MSVDRNKRQGNRDNPSARVYVALDIESTGGGETDQGEIIEVAAIRFRLEEGGVARILERWQTLVRPRNPIPYKITHLTGIRQTDVEHAPTFNEIREKLQQFLGNFPLVGHSIESDFAFLSRQEFRVTNIPLDTYELATLILPQMGNYSLVAVATALEIQANGEAHRALADTYMAMNVFAALLGKLEELPRKVINEVNRIASNLQEWHLRRLFEEASEILARQERNSGGLGSLGALLKQQLSEKQGSDHDFIFLASQDKPQSLQPNPDFKFPYSALNERIASASLPIRAILDSNQHMLLEMPGNDHTRAMGLLAPAIEIAVQSGQSVVIAANSETQRDRILNKAIPEMQKLLATQETTGDNSNASKEKRRKRSEEKPLFIANTVKHQNSYLCLRRWENFRNMEGLTADELKLLIKALLWLPNTINGDSAELRIMQQERLWSRINTQKGLCLASHCQYNQRHQCFYFKARDRAEASHIIVTDQALVLADAAGQAGTLPHFDYTLIDDAHHLEDEAGRQFGSAITPNTLFDFLDWIYRPVTWKAEGGSSGFLSTFSRYFGDDTGAEIKEPINSKLSAAISHVGICRSSTDNLLRDLTDLVNQINQDSGQGDGRIRLDGKFYSSPEWGGIAGTWEVFKQDWEELYYDLRDLRDEAHNFKGALHNTEDMMLNLNYYINQADYFLNRLSPAFEGSDNAQVHWLSLHPRTQLVGIFSAPLQVDSGLQHMLFNHKKSVVLASPTMTTDGDFKFLRNRLGLHEAKELKLYPERDYAATTLLYLPNDMPEPSQPGYQKAIDQHIIDMVKGCEGRMLALFTSNSSLRMTYKAVQRPLEQQNILVLGMGLDGTRRSVLNRFKNTPHALLLSTLGHWDNPELFKDEENSPLSFALLAITKLPFDPPSDPVFAARIESRQYNDPFLQYSLPRTILRFKQAYERLLEAMPERGVVVVLDSRLTRRAYGPTFLNSLPALRTKHDTLTHLTPELRNWLGL
ncbi:exonuclease domain-containing protein [Candidatus Chlorohelix sp.]|uniref:exonuclease domain-containing protein n=1 Tax=Candidatus Chlorohelix sp. TaxID=3139201 RepID=UPI0030288B63